MHPQLNILTPSMNQFVIHGFLFIRNQSITWRYRLSWTSLKFVDTKRENEKSKQTYQQRCIKNTKKTKTNKRQSNWNKRKMSHYLFYSIFHHSCDFHPTICWIIKVKTAMILVAKIISFIWKSYNKRSSAEISTEDRAKRNYFSFFPSELNLG